MGGLCENRIHYDTSLIVLLNIFFSRILFAHTNRQCIFPFEFVLFFFFKFVFFVLFSLNFERNNLFYLIMSNWIKKRINQLKSSWTAMTLVERPKPIPSNDVMVSPKDLKKSHRLHDKNVRVATQDYMDYCEQVYLNQNNCAKRCAKSGEHRHKPLVVGCIHKSNATKKNNVQANKRVQLDEFKQSEFLGILQIQQS